MVQVFNQELAVLATVVMGRVMEPDNHAGIDGGRVKEHQTTESVASHVNPGAARLESRSLKQNTPSSRCIKSSSAALEVDVLEVDLLVRVDDASRASIDSLKPSVIDSVAVDD